MKRLVRYPVEAADEISLVNLAKEFLTKLFKGLDSTLDIISSWAESSESATNDADDTTNSDASNDSNGSDLPSHFVLEIMPVNDDEDWDTGPVYRMLVKQMGEDDDYVSIRFDMKSKDGSTTASEGVTFKRREADESEEDVDKRAKKMLYTMASKLLKRCSDEKYEDVAEIRHVGPGTWNSN